MNLSARQVFTATLAVLVGLLTGYVFLVSLRILVILLIAIIIASAVRPLVMRLKRWRVPEGLAILFVYAGIIFGILLVTVVLLPPIINQFADYLDNDWRLANRIIISKAWIEGQLSSLTNQPVSLGSSEGIRESVSGFLATVRASAPDVLDDVGGLLGEMVLIVVMGVYWLTSRDKAINFVTRLVPLALRNETEDALKEIESSMGAYIRGIVAVALFVGIANTLILLLLRVPNAATYGLIVGLTTMLPVVGGFIGGGLATVLAALGSVVHGLAVFGTFVAVQQIENHYLTPRTMARSFKVDPLLVMVGVFVGWVIYGVLGAIISIPILGTVNVLLRVFVVEPRKEEVAGFELEQGVPVLRPEPGGTPKIVTPSTAERPGETKPPEILIPTEGKP